MNKAILIGRLTTDPEVRYSQGNEPMAIARYTLAVDRRYKKEGEQTADFIRCVAFGKNGQFAEKYLHKGMKIVVAGRIQTGSYQDQETGKKVYTTDIVVEAHDFAESKQGGTQAEQPQPTPVDDDGFMKIPDNVDDSGLPFNF